MKRLTGILFAGLVLATATISPAASRAKAPAKPAATQPADANGFKSAKYGFSIRPPDGWQRVEAKFPIAVSFREPDGNTPADFHENFSVVAEEVPAGVDLDAFVKGVLASGKKYSTHPEMVTSKRIKLGGVPARRVILKFKLGNTDCRAISYMCVRNARGYTISFSTTARQFAQYQPIFDKIARSFRTFKPTDADPRIFRSERHGFSMAEPFGWRKIDLPAPVIVAFVKPQVETTSQPAVLGVILQRVSTDVNFNREPQQDTDTMFVRGFIDGLTGTFRNPKVVSSKRVKFGKQWAYRIVIRHEYRLTGEPATSVNCVIVTNGRCYSIMCVCPTRKFAKVEPAFNEVCKTFKTFKPGPPKPRVFVSKADGFRITGPAGWRQTTGPRPRVVTYTMEKAKPSDPNYASITVTTEVVPHGMGLDGFASAGFKSLRTIEVISSAKVKLNGQPAVRAILRRKSNNKDKSLMYIVVANGMGYAIHCFTEADQYDKCEPLFEKVCGTFETFPPAKTPGKAETKNKSEVSPDNL